MANKSISMSKIRHLIQLYSRGRCKKLISEQTDITRNTPKKYLQEFINSRLSIEEIQEHSDKELEDLFIKPDIKPANSRLATLTSLFPSIQGELKKKGVTRDQLWRKYKDQYPDGLKRIQFHLYYSLWKRQSSLSMHIEHKLGDRMYVDFAGDQLDIVDKDAKEIQTVEVFIAILGAFQLTYLESVM